MSEAALFSPHLKPGEQIVWSAAASEALLAAHRNRARLIGAATAITAGLIAILLASRFFESVGSYGTADVAASILVPLYAAFALAMAALAFVGLRRLSPKPPAATHFALTNQRLIALGPAGSLADEIAGAEIDSVIAGGRAQSPDIYVLRKDDPNERRFFAIEHIDRPLEAKAIIEDTFPPNATETTP